MMYRFPTHLACLMASIGLGFSVPALAQDQAAQRLPQNPILQAADEATDGSRASPARRIQRQRPPPLEDTAGAEIRSYDGSGNNRQSLGMGATLSPLARWMANDYSDGISTLAGEDRPSPRLISNIVSAQTELMPNNDGTSDFVWQWGQFLDHDIDLTDGVEPAESAPIAVPAGDRFFDPDGSGNASIGFNRSIYDDSGESRQQINEISAWIDASNVYGSDAERAIALRRLDGSGKLKTSEGDLLPYNEAGLSNAGGSSAELFLAGDVRANEQAGLTVMHTLFMREHNRLADIIVENNPELNGEQIYQRARKLVGAEMQIITYREYLPALLGRGALNPYQGYRPDVNASIANIFSTAAYRYGHSALSPQLLRLDANGDPIAAGPLPLRDAFFSPAVLAEDGIEPILRGLAAQPHQAIDPFIIDDVRNFLFGPPGSGGFDLASLNIQRGRDHGLPGYNDARAAIGLERLPADGFARISSNPDIRRRLREAYGSVDNIDVWVGGLAEDPLPGALVGELIYTVLKQQFEVLRDGDRFWHQRVLTPPERELVGGIRLADIIRNNSDIADEIPNNVFYTERPPRRGDGRRDPANQQPPTGG